MEATKLFINNAEFVGIAIFSPRSWNNSMVNVINHVSQTKPTTAQVVFSIMHREGSGGFSEALGVVEWRS